MMRTSAWFVGRYRLFFRGTIPALLAFLAAGSAFLAAEYCTAVFGGGCGGRYLTANPKRVILAVVWLVFQPQSGDYCHGP